eukprot:4619519-Pyramimonas_sp.AAC.3
MRASCVRLAHHENIPTRPASDWSSTAQGARRGTRRSIPIDLPFVGTATNRQIENAVRFDTITSGLGRGRCGWPTGWGCAWGTPAGGAAWRVATWRRAARGAVGWSSSPLD